MSKKEEAIKEVKNIWNGNELTYPKKTIEALERAKKVEELLGLYKQLGGIEQDIEYLCGLRDCVIEYSVEQPI